MFDCYNYHTKKITAPSSHPCTLCAHVLMLNASDAAVTDAAAATDRKRRRRAAGEKSLDFIHFTKVNLLEFFSSFWSSDDKALFVF